MSEKKSDEKTAEQMRIEKSFTYNMATAQMTIGNQNGSQTGNQKETELNDRAAGKIFHYV